MDEAAERRFSCVRAIVGRPSRKTDGDGHHLDDKWKARKYRARRLEFDLDLWPRPPPTPKMLPPAQMNSGCPRLADPDDAAGDAARMGAHLLGFDPSRKGKGAGRAPHKPNGIFQMGGTKFLGDFENGTASSQGESSPLAQALISLRAGGGRDDASSLVRVPAGCLKAATYFTWTRSMLPRPRTEVTVAGDFNGWKPMKLQPSARNFEDYEVEVR